MENQLWNLFLETGDPMSYLLIKAEENSKTAEQPDGKQPGPTGAPPASF